MPIFAVTYRYSADVATRDAEHRDHLRPTGLHTLLLILCTAVRRSRPTWEDWQVAVDLHPVAGLEPVTAVEGPIVSDSEVGAGVACMMSGVARSGQTMRARALEPRRPS